MEWVLSGLLVVLVYMFCITRRRDAARATAASLRNAARRAVDGPDAPFGVPDTQATAPAGTRTDAAAGPPLAPQPGASVLQPRPRVLRIREKPDR